MPNRSLEDQIKNAEKQKLIAETGKAIAEKSKIEIESSELSKEYSRKWFARKEFWSILIGTLIAWTAVAFYITFSVVPLSEIHVNQATLENLKKSDTLYNKEKQLIKATQEIQIRQQNLISLQKENEWQKNLNLKLQLQIDTFYKKINKLSLIGKGNSSLKEETNKLKRYIDGYNNLQTKSLLIVPPSQQIQKTTSSNKTIMTNTNLVSANLEGKLSQFKEQESKNPSNTELAKKKELFDKVIGQIQSSVAKLISQLGDNFGSIQTGKGYDFKNMTYEDRYGIISSFDNSKKIWPTYNIKNHRKPAYNYHERRERI